MNIKILSRGSHIQSDKNYPSSLQVFFNRNIYIYIFILIENEIKRTSVMCRNNRQIEKSIYERKIIKEYQICQNYKFDNLSRNSLESFVEANYIDV